MSPASARSADASHQSRGRPGQAGSQEPEINRQTRRRPTRDGGRHDPPEEFEEGNIVLEAARRYHEEFGADPDAVAIILALQRANALLVQSVDRFVESLDLGVNLSLGRLRMLRAIYFGEDHTVTLNDLGRLVKVSRTNITNLIDAMERDGLVRRTINLVDRRVINAELTPKGLEICAVVLPAISRYMEDVTQAFSRQEKVLFVDLFSRLQGELSSRGEADEASF